MRLLMCSWRRTTAGLGDDGIDISYNKLQQRNVNASVLSGCRTLAQMEEDNSKLPSRSDVASACRKTGTLVLAGTAAAFLVAVGGSWLYACC